MAVGGVGGAHDGDRVGDAGGGEGGVGAALVLVGGAGDGEEGEGGAAANASLRVNALVWVFVLEEAGWHGGGRGDGRARGEGLTFAVLHHAAGLAAFGGWGLVFLVEFLQFGLDVGGGGLKFGGGHAKEVPELKDWDPSICADDVFQRRVEAANLAVD